MTESKTYKAERSSIGDVVLWLALAALVAIVIIGVATLMAFNPSLSAVAWPDPSAPSEPRIAN